MPAIPALVLAAGLATRLRPLSLVRAKAALPVAGVSLAERVLRWLATHGVADAVLNLHHLPQTITRLVGDGSQLGLRVRYSFEEKVLGTAGGPRHALPLLEASRFIVVNGDTLTDVDLAAVVRTHQESGALVTMALVPNPEPARYGGVLVEDGRITGFTPRGTPGRNYHFIGVQVVEREVFAALPDNLPAESVGQVYPSLLRLHPARLRAFVCDARFEDIGTPADYFATSLSVAAREGVPDVQTGRNVTVVASARLKRCILWDDITVGADVVLADCVVADGVRVRAGTTLNRRLVLPEPGDNLLIAPF